MLGRRAANGERDRPESLPEARLRQSVWTGSADAADQALDEQARPPDRRTPLPDRVKRTAVGERRAILGHGALFGTDAQRLVGRELCPRHERDRLVVVRRGLPRFHPR